MTTDHQPQQRSERVNKTGIRRKRLGLSCRECKRRKVKCGRQQPVCTRCTEIGHPEQCVYDQPMPNERLSVRPGVHTPLDDFNALTAHNAAGYFPASASAAAVPNVYQLQQHDGSRRRVEELESRLRDLERTLDGANVPLVPGASPPSDRLTTDSLNHDTDNDGTAPFDAETEPIIIPGSAFKTRFFGASHSASVIAHIDGFGDVVESLASNHPILGAPTWQLQVPYTRMPTPRLSLEDLDGQLRAAVPAEPRCRHLIHNYFRHFEGLYRILYAPLFWKQYNDFWTGTGAPTSFVALLLSAISCARCLYVDDDDTYDGDSSCSRLEAARWIELAEAWHDLQSHKHTTLAILQIKCLVVLSKQINLIKPKRHYAACQALMAAAISIGLHREPPRSRQRRVSFFERELRRRLWATIAELELAGCVERGVPSTVASLHGDVNAPANIHDNDFDETTIDDPPVRPDAQVTQSSFLRVASGLRPLRYAINTLVNNPRKHRMLTQADLNAYHHQIVRRLAEVPSFEQDGVGTGEIGEPSNEKTALFSASAKMQIHDLLLMLHLPFAFANDAHPAANHSRYICSSSARSIVDLYSSLGEHGLSQICLMRFSIVRASLCLCLAPSPSAGYATLYPPVPVAEKLSLMRRVFALYETRFLSFGWGSRALWLLIAASCYIDPAGVTAPGSTWRNEMPDTVAVLFRRVCTRQIGSLDSGVCNDALFAKYIRHIRQTLEPAQQSPSLPIEELESKTCSTDFGFDGDRMAFSDFSDMNSFMHDSVAADWTGMSVDDFEFFGMADS